VIGGPIVKRVCAWCHADLDTVSPPGTRADDDTPISHGICDRCSEYLLARRIPLQDLLESLGVPVLAVDGDVRVQAVSSAACAVIGKKASEVVGGLGGEVLECRHCREPGGCGKTVHCVGCAIRTTVTDTWRTGTAHEAVPAYTHVRTAEGVTTIQYILSTEKVGGVVLLRIDGALPQPQSAR